MSTTLRSCLVLCLLAVLLPSCSARRTGVITTPENRHLKGWQRPYEIRGERYTPLLKSDGFVEEGLASWYGADFHGKPTSNGETYDMYALTAAHKTLPLGVFVKARNRRNGKEVVVRINDRGPFVRDRIIDLSFTAAKELGIVDAGITPVRIEALGYGETDSGTLVFRRPQSFDAGSYAIQIAAFTSTDTAKRLAAKMESQHGHSRIQEAVVNGTRFFRVQAGRYDSLKKAEEARFRFEREGYPGNFVVALD